MHVKGKLVAFVIFAQLALCGFLTQREFRHFLSARASWFQAMSYHSYYVCSPAYEADLAQKRGARPSEVVVTQGDFIVETIDGWEVTMTRHRNGSALLTGLTILSTIQAVMVLITMRRSA
jgi:hypothetical protein